MIDKILDVVLKSCFSSAGREKENERKGRSMRKIDLIVIHCSASRADRDFTETDLRCATAGGDLTVSAITSTSGRTGASRRRGRLNG